MQVTTDVALQRKAPLLVGTSFFCLEEFGVFFFSPSNASLNVAPIRLFTLNEAETYLFETVFHKQKPKQKKPSIFKNQLRTHNS